MVKAVSRDDLLFERHNSKYNRLWSQITDFMILASQTVLAYVFAIMAIADLSTEIFVYSFIFVVFVLMIFCVVIGKLELERLETKAYLNMLLRKCENDYR